jgi:hypothetical protein
VSITNPTNQRVSKHTIVDALASVAVVVPAHDSAYMSTADGALKRAIAKIKGQR